MALFGAPFKNLFKPLFGKAQPESVYAPYIPQAKEEEEKKRKRQGVLQFIFDRLSTGQYVVANLVDEILTSAKDGDPLAKDVVDTLKAMGEGVIGTRRGDWQEILKRRLPEGAFTQKPVFGENREGKFLGKTTGADVVGFLANIFLDPTTYISFGATKGAEVAAKSVADDTAKILAKAVSNIGDDVGKAAVKSIDNVLGEAIEQASKGFKYTKFAKLKAADPLKAQKYVAKHMTDLAKVQDQVYRSTLKQARYMGANELKNFMGKRLGLADNLTDQAFEQAVRQLPGELQDIGLRALTGYSQGATPGATKLGSFFGKEFGVKVRTPEQLARTKAITGPLAVLTGNPGGSRATWDSVSEGIKRVFHQSDAGRGLSDAMWGLMNRGVIGDIRKKLNMGNKYQKYLRQIELDTKGVSAKAYMDLARKYYSEAGETNTRKVAQWLIEHEEPFEKVASYQRKSARDLVNGYLKAGVTESAPKEVLEAISRNPDELVRSVDTIRNITDELAHIEKGWAAKGLPEMGYIENYVPKSWRKTASVSGPSSTGFMKGREFTSLQTTDMKKNWLKRYTGWSDETINDVVDSGATDLIRDVDELMAMRIMGHAKAASRINMIEKFKELGIPKKGLEEAAAGGGSNIAELGLKSVDHPLLQDVLFDKDIADILERSMAATGKEMGAVQRIFANTTNWWRQLVTMTTGFHIRNFVSNNFTGFMKHGTKWFNTKYSVPALVGVAYATKLQNPSGWMDLAKNMVNIDERGVYKMLNKTYGQGRNVKTLKELIDDAMNLRVISESQQGMDPLNLMQKVQGMDRMKGTTFNPLPQLGENPKDFIIARGSRHVGNIVENTPRFESFLIDFDELAGKSTERIDTLLKDGLITEADLPRLGNNAQEYAALEAKKWFIDYENLTDTEKNVLKNIIPFYTWIRSNISNQLSGIVTYPWIYSMVPKLEEFMKYEDPNYDESLVPDYMKQLGYFPVSSRQKNLMSFINPNLPFQDLARIPLLFQDDEGAGQWIPQLSWKEVKDDIVGAAHPLIKTVVESIPEKGYDTWRKRDLDDRGVAPAVLRYFTVNPEALQKIDGVLRYAGFERGLDARKNEEGKLELNSKLLKVLENNLPWVRVFDQLFKTGLQVADMANTDPEFVQKIEEISGEKTEEDALNRLFNVLSWWGGFKQRAVNMTEEEQRMQKTIYSRAQALYNDRLRTPQEQQTRLTRSAKSNERIRKLVR